MATSGTGVDRGESLRWKFVLGVGAAVSPPTSLLPDHGQPGTLYQAVGVLAGRSASWSASAIHRPADRASWYLLATGAACLHPGRRRREHLCGHPPRASAVPRRPPTPSTWPATRSSSPASCASAATPTLRPTGGLRRRRHHGHRGPGHLVALPDERLRPRPVADHARDAGDRWPIRSWTSPLVFVVFRSLLFGGSKPTVPPAAGRRPRGHAPGRLRPRPVGPAHHGYATGNPVDALFLLGYLLLGAAALHPSVGEAVPLAPNRSRTSTPPGRRPAPIPVVAFAGFIPPSILLVASCPRPRGRCDRAVRHLPGRLRPHLPADDVAHRADHRADQRDRGARPRPRGVPPPTGRPRSRPASPGLP